MPRRYKNKRGGFSFQNTWGSITQGATDALNKTKQGVSSAYDKTKVGATDMYNTTKVGVSSAYDKTKVGATDMYNKTKQGVSSAYGNARDTISNSLASMSGSVGGKTRKRRGGSNVLAKTPLNGIASHASSVSNVPTAKPHNIVGGRKTIRRRKHRHSRSCRHKKH